MLVIVGLMAGMFLSSLDQTIVSTAIRTIGDDLHGLEQQAWVTTAYMITSTISTPIYGKLSDVFGRRPLYLFGIFVFIIGSLLSSFSTSMMMLAAFRAFQGIGAGALMSLPMAIMGDMLAPRDRAKYQGYFMAIFGISSVLGPLVGGMFAGADEIFWIAGWRWVFLINVPIGIIAFAMVWVFLHLPKFGDDKAKPRIDWWGATFVIVALVPMLLIAEQGRDWGWTSAAAFTCYGIATVGLIAFLIIESRMGNDAIIPLGLFKSGTFSMSTILGFLVGFGMFGAMMTIPLFLQIVLGLTPTESGFATLPMMAGIMLASIVSGIMVSRTGSYRIFPILGTFLLVCGYYYLTFMTIDRPLWFLMIGMFIIGLGLGQLMQSLTLAAQNSVAPSYMGVATSAATFFRQIGGTLGTAVLISVLFTSMPTNIQKTMGNEDDLRPALEAALTPAVAQAPENQGIMDQMWNDIVNPVKENIQTQLDEGTAQAKQAADDAVQQQVSQAVQAQVDAGAVPAFAAPGIIAQQVEQARPAAEEQALKAVAEKANATVTDGKVSVDWNNDAQRAHWVDQLAPTMADEINKHAEDENSDDTKGKASTSDTSYLNGADARLTRPFMEGFNKSTMSVYWVGLGVTAFAFILTLFFKVPPLRQTSALQDSADAAAARDTKDNDDVADVRPAVESADQGAEAPRETDPEVLRNQLLTASTGAIPVVSAAAPAGSAPVREVVSESSPTEGKHFMQNTDKIEPAKISEAQIPGNHPEPAQVTPTETSRPEVELLNAPSNKNWAVIAGSVAAGLAAGGALFSVVRRLVRRKK